MSLSFKSVDFGHLKEIGLHNGDGGHVQTVEVLTKTKTDLL